jgi:hypothetical protein
MMSQPNRTLSEINLPSALVKPALDRQFKYFTDNNNNNNNTFFKVAYAARFAPRSFRATVTTMIKRERLT